MRRKIVIVGAGQAGAQAAASLRQEGFDGDIALIGAEAEPPYQRPPLSKAYLKGELEPDRLWLRPEEFFARERIELRTGAYATRIDRERRAVALASGEKLPYDSLLLSTGAKPRRLLVPGAEFDGVHYLRTIADSDALRPILSSKEQVAIIGAGYIGLEVAAVAREAGAPVTVIESESRPLARVTGAEIAGFFARLHSERGVAFRFNARVERIEGKARVKSVRLDDGSRISCGAVLVAVGAEPETQLAQEAGLTVDNGITVDEYGRTSDPDIFACGDCANFPSPLYGRRMRLESVPNAIDGAKAVAANLAGRATAYDSVPWFWSDQYEAKLQTAGVFSGADATVVRLGEGLSRSVWYLKEGRVIAVDAVNDPQAFFVGRKLVGARAITEAKRLADPALALKSLLR